MTQLEISQQLEALMGMTDPSNLSFTVPSEESIEAAMSQWEILNNIAIDDEQLDMINAVIDAIDVLNEKYRPSFDFTNIDAEEIYGLQLSLERATGAILYGALGQMFVYFETQPDVFQAMFGRRLGRVTYVHAQKEAQRLEQIQAWREQAGDNFSAFRAMIEDEVSDLGRDQMKLVTSLGYSEETAKRILDDLYLSRVKGEAIDMDSISDEIHVSVSEANKQRIKEGRALMDSGLYVAPDRVNRIEDDRKRRKIQRALQDAKDKDRLQAKRKTERGKKDD